MERNLKEDKLDTFVCVHQRDVDYLLEMALRAYELYFQPKNRLIFVTNDVPHLRQFLERLQLKTETVLTGDSDWLSKQELELPGWYRQQVIKLRAYEFCETPNFCNLGADTILLQPLTLQDLVCDNTPILHYTSHPLPDPHRHFEQQRVEHVGKILQVDPVRARHYVDFINDLFGFNRELLLQLNQYLTKLYGTNCYFQLLQGLNTTSDQNKFGEWTLYSVYLLDALQYPVALQDTRNGFLYQVHSQRLLWLYRFNTKVVHFVGKNFDVNYIKRQIQKHGLALGQYLQFPEQS